MNLKQKIRDSLTNTFLAKFYLILSFFILLYSISYFFIISPKIKYNLIEKEKTSFKMELEKISQLIDYHVNNIQEYEKKLHLTNTEDINKKVEEKRLYEISRIKELIKKTKIKKDGYILIIDNKTKIFMHPIKEFDNTSIKLFEKINGVDFIKAVKKAYKNNTPVKYLWRKEKTNDLEEKIAWVDYNKFFDWYIISTSYKKELVETYIDINNKIILISMFIFLILFIITAHFVKQITNPLKDLIKNISTFQDGNYNEEAYIKIDSHDEFSLFSDNFNEMRKKITHNINSLENEVYDRTKELEHRLYFDPLTNLKNVNSLIDTIKKEDFVSIILIDLNKFRDINELYGYEMGSTIIKRFANTLNQFQEKYGLDLYRIDGVTFALLKTGVLNFLPFSQKVKKILDKLNNNPIYLPEINDNIFLNITVGISVCQESPLKTAFTALNKAKRENNNFCLFNNEIDEKKIIEKNLYWSKKIKYSIIEKNIVPFFQAIVDENKNIIKYETLMRMKDEDKFISPINFLEISKKTKQYAVLSHTILSKALKKLEETSHSISINMSFCDTQDAVIRKILDSKVVNKELASRLTIEILEDDQIEDYQSLKDFISYYKNLGVKFAIDDFGTGYSNLINILELNPDYIKIDGSLIKNIDKDLTSLKLVKSIVKFSEEMGIKVIAEFVHNEVVFNKLKALNIHGYQGYYFNEPASDFSTL